MENTTTIRPEDISEHYIDIKKVLANKGVNLPNFAVALVNRLLHVDEINHTIYTYRDKFGVDFAQAFVKEDLKVDVKITGESNIPVDGAPIIAGNHPLGGPDGVALISAVGDYRRDIKFPVNDFLMYLPGLRPVFIPVDKVHRNTANVDALEQGFAEKNALLYFPAGLCSRKQKNGEICDLEWKPTFIKKAIKYQRDIVPVFFDARNRKRFYTIANLRKKLGIKFGFEMALLPCEMFAQRGKSFHLIIGKPIPYSTFDNSHTAKEWAELVKKHVYSLKENPELEFQA